MCVGMDDCFHCKLLQQIDIAIFCIMSHNKFVFDHRVEFCLEVLKMDRKEGSNRVATSITRLNRFGFFLLGLLKRPSLQNKTSKFG